MTAITGARDSVRADFPAARPAKWTQREATPKPNTGMGEDGLFTPVRLPAGSTRNRQPCGTPAAARRHHKRGEELDEACREAFRRFHREYRRQARAIAAFRQREREAGIRWEQRVKTDPLRRARRRRQQQESARRRDEELRNYVDPVVVDRLVAGVNVPRTKRERLAAAQVLRNRGLSYSVIAAHLGVSQRQVHRDLSDLGMVKAA